MIDVEAHDQCRHVLGPQFVVFAKVLNPFSLVDIGLQDLCVFSRCVSGGHSV